MPEAREPELSDLYGLVLSHHAVARARFEVLLESQARILAHLEDRPDDAVAEELRARFEAIKERESDALKEYMRHRAATGG